jgi:hypothetical protein
MAMKRRNFDRVYPMVRFASSAMTRNYSQKRIRETANPNVGRAAVALVRSPTGTISLDRGGHTTNESTAALGQPSNSMNE